MSTQESEHTTMAHSNVHEAIAAGVTTCFAPNDPEFTGTTVVEIDASSGLLIAADSLCSVEHFDVQPPMSINHGTGRDAFARAFAEQANTAYAFVGNTCPKVALQADGTIEVVSPAWDEEADEEVPNEDETVLASICTDLWATMLTDYQNWLDHGGPHIGIANDNLSIDRYTIFDVTPGKYQWTAFSHTDGFDIDAEGRIVYARLELIEAY